MIDEEQKRKVNFLKVLIEFQSTGHTFETYNRLKNIYYQKHVVGGPCHLVLDDDNVECFHINYCMNECIKQNDYEGFVLMSILLNIEEHLRKSYIYGFSIV